MAIVCVCVCGGGGGGGSGTFSFKSTKFSPDVPPPHPSQKNVIEE